MRSAFLLLLACGTADNRLFGSVSEVYELQFDKVVINRIDKQIAIEYQKANGAKTVKLAIYIADLTIDANSSIDLTGMVGNVPRASIQRIVETTAVDMQLEQGTITFSGPPDAGATVSGTFRTRTSMPAGRTLNGDFKATVTQL
mgnify:CR=1 FL=1